MDGHHCHTPYLYKRCLYSQRVEEPPRVPRKISIVSACVAHDPSSEPFSFLSVLENDAGSPLARQTKNAGSTPAQSLRFGNDGSLVRFQMMCSCRR